MSSFDRANHTYNEWLDWCKKWDLCPDCEQPVEQLVEMCSRWHGPLRNPQDMNPLEMPIKIEVRQYPHKFKCPECGCEFDG